MARKLLFLVVVLAIVAILGAPYVFGMQAHQLHQNYADKLTAAGSTSLKESDFSRGWFRSSARDVIEFCSTAGGCKSLVISSVLHHGPIAITGIMDGVAPLAPVQAVMVSTVKFGDLAAGAKLQPELPNLTVTIVAQLDGSSRATVSMPSSTHTGEGKGGKITLALGGVDGSLAGTADSSRIQGDVTLRSFKLEDAAGTAISLNGVNTSFDGEGSEAGFLGTANEKVDSITMTSGADDPQPMEIKGLKLSLNGSRSADGLSQTKFNADIQTLAAGGRAYGPAKLEGETLRVNRAALTRMQKEVEALEAQQKPPQELLPAVMGVYQKNLGEVLKSRPELNLKTVSIKAPEGELLSSLKLVAVPPPGELNMSAWLQILQSEFTLQIPAATLWNILDAQLQQAAQQTGLQSGQPAVVPTQDEIGAKVTELVKSNILVPKLDANAYTMQVDFLEGRLLVNGQENQGFANLSALLKSQPAPPVEAPPATP